MEEEPAEQIKNFLVRFFKSLGAEVHANEKAVLVLNVPNSFEQFIGEKAPYEFVFDAEDLEQREGAELIAQGSYMIKEISRFLQETGRTCSLKLPGVSKHSLDLHLLTNLATNKKYKLKIIRKEEALSFLSRFIFKVSFESIRGKIDLFKEVYINDGQVMKVNFNNSQLEDYNPKVNEQTGSIEKEYALAAQKAVEFCRLDGEFTSLKRELEERLEKELKRVQRHFQDNPYEEERQNLKEELKDIEGGFKSLTHEPPSESRQIKEESLGRQREFFKNQLINLETNVNARLEREIEQEKNRYALHISPLLINYSKIYYTTEKYTLLLSTPSFSAELEVLYDSLQDKITLPKCSSCGNSLHNPVFCSSGHLVCGNCAFHCESCNKELCKECKVSRCAVCGNKVCADCLKHCQHCGHNLCKNHLLVCLVCKKVSCEDCLQKCSSCLKLICKGHFQKSELGKKDVCKACADQKNDARPRLKGKV